MAGKKETQKPDMRVVTMAEYNKLLLKAIRHDPKKYEMKDGVPVKKSRK